MTPYEWIILSDCDVVSMIAPAVLPEYYNNLRSLGIDYHSYDYDPKFNNNHEYTVGDVIFDGMVLSGLLVNFNAQKMYPIGKIHTGQMIICGSDRAHNGDCNVVTSCEQLIEQNNIHTVYGQMTANHNGYNKLDHTVYLVWGRND